MPTSSLTTFKKIKENEESVTLKVQSKININKSKVKKQQPTRQNHSINHKYQILI